MFEPERRDLAWVPRWSIVRVNRRQSVAEHCYFVTCYGLEIAKRIKWPNVEDGPDYQGGADWQLLNDLALYLLRHDEAEAITGDLPGPLKRRCGWDEEKLAPLLRERYGAPPSYSEDMKAIRKAADLVDECLYLAGELNSGNRGVESTLLNSRQRLLDAIELLPATEAAKDELQADLLARIQREMCGTKNLEGFRRC